MIDETTTHNNPARYREMSVPHPSSEALNEAMRDFFKDLGELRRKYKLRDVYVCLQSPYVASDGVEELNAMANFGYGDPMQHELMLAYALGVVQTERQEMVSRALGHAIKKGKTRE